AAAVGWASISFPDGRSMSAGAARASHEARSRPAEGHGTVTEQVAPATGVMPSGEKAVATVHVKSPAPGGVAPEQSSKLILKSCPGRGVIAVAFTTTSRSAESGSL